MENEAILSVQLHQLREVAELRGDGASELIPGEVPERTAMSEQGFSVSNSSRIIRNQKDYR